ncbi:MAG: CinA family protein [Pseudolabrys sp.]|nr:CinA family protein [Pseudolabrys sp.]MSP32095.1 CinA family protein [Pseudolabrys sp.]
MSNKAIIKAATALIELCASKGFKIATAESCTGGLVAGALTEVPGSSAVFERGYVTYSNDAKQEMLGVAFATVDKFGAVSREAAIAMARGALRAAHADLVVAITGVAGPGGGTAGKPVGLVHFAATTSTGKGKLVHVEMRYGNIGRKKVREKSVLQALAMLKELAVKR